MRSRILALLCCVLSFSLACNRTAPPKEGETAKPTVALVLKTLNSPFFIEMQRGAQAEADRLGVTLVVQAAEREVDVDKQMQIIENLIQTRVGALAITPSGSKEIVTAIAKANAAGIPVVIVDTRVDPAAAQEAGFASVRLNAIAIRSLTEVEIVPLARFARARGLELRFIEYMPLDAEQHWQAADVLDGDTIRAMLEAEFGPLLPVAPPHPSQPATDFVYSDGGGRIGLINPVSQPFCGDCDRLRLTAEGQVRNCLFSTKEWDARKLLREGDSDEEIADLVRDCVWAKAPAHGIGSDDFVRPERAMYQIGG